MKHTIGVKTKDIYTYCVLILALIQSEIYWICSVVYCLLKKCRLIQEDKSTHSKTKHLSNSPSRGILQTGKSTPSRTNSVRFADDYAHPEMTSIDMKVHIHKTPTEYDEKNGNTCPPRWWQKTRVMLGHTPIPGYPKIPSQFPCKDKHSPEQLSTSPDGSIVYESDNDNSSVKSKKKIISKINDVLSHGRRESLESKFKKIVK